MIPGAVGPLCLLNGYRPQLSLWRH